MPQHPHAPQELSTPPGQTKTCQTDIQLQRP